MNGSWLKAATWALLIVVVGAIAGGLWIVGSPVQARQVASDRKRVNDLGQLAEAARSTFASTGKFPVDQAALLRKSRWSPKDPLTGKPYEYRVIDAQHFELCADFEADSPKGNDWYPYWDSTFSSYRKGHFCFTLAAKRSAD